MLEASAEIIFVFAHMTCVSVRTTMVGNTTTHHQSDQITIIVLMFPAVTLVMADAQEALIADIRINPNQTIVSKATHHAGVLLKAIVRLAIVADSRTIKLISKTSTLSYLSTNLLTLRSTLLRKLTYSHYSTT